MRQLNLTESQIEILLRALSNESTVDQDLDRRRVLTVPELIERRDSRLVLKRILNASLESSYDLAQVKSLVDRTLQDFETGLVTLLGQESSALTSQESVQSKARQARAMLYSVAQAYSLNLGLKFPSESTDKSQT